MSMTIKYKIEGKFSELFPKSFAFIKNLMPVKYGWPKDAPVPDLPVVIFVDDQYKVTRWSSVPALYHPNRKEIIIFAKTMLENTLPDTASGRGIIEFPKLENKLFSDRRLLCKYLDGQGRFRTILIHEFQHFLQYYLGKKFLGSTVKSKVSLPEGATVKGFRNTMIEYLKDRIRKNSKLNAIKQELADLDNTINSINDILTRQYHFSKPALKYLFDPEEVEARIVQMIEAAIEGHKPGYYLGELFDVDIISRDVDTLTNSISLLKEELKGKSFREKHAIKKDIKKMKLLVWKYKEHIKIVRASIKETQSIANEIRSSMAKNT